MTISYSAPPLNPELNASSKYYSTTNEEIVITRGDGLGFTRGLVHNWCPRLLAGMSGFGTGSEPKVVTNAFPFNSPADGLYAGDYALRCTNSTRSVHIPYGAYLPASSTVAGTIRFVFKCETIDGPQNVSGSTAFAPIAGLSPSCYYNLSQSTVDFSTHQNTTLWGIYSNGTGLFMGHITTNGVIFTANCPVVAGRWYAFACAFYDGTGTGVDGVTSLAKACRYYLHDLTNDTRISTTGSTNQTFNNPSFGNQTNSQFAGWNYGLDTVYTGAKSYDLVLFPGRSVPGAGGPTCNADFVGQIKQVALDRTFWDDSGNGGTAKWFAVPGAFSGSDQFTTWISNIYEPITGTYATGASPPTICNGASGQSNAAPRVISYPYLPTTSTAPTGTYTGTPVVAAGDCTVTRNGSTSVDITLSRPQAAPIAPGVGWTWNLYASKTRQATPGAGNLIQSITGITGTPTFNFAPTDGEVWFARPVASDGTNTYTYPETPVNTRPLDALPVAFVGNSILTGTGRSPDKYFGQTINALGVECPMISMAIDGTLSSQWLPTDASTSVFPAWAGTTNRYNRLKTRLQTEAAYLPDGKFAAVFLQLIGNDAPLSSVTNYTTIANQLLADGFTRKVVFLATPFQPFGHSLINNTSKVSDSLAVQKTAANGSTIFSIGDQAMQDSIYSLQAAINGHPDTYLATLQGTLWALEYYTTIENPGTTTRKIHWVPSRRR